MESGRQRDGEKIIDVNTSMEDIMKLVEPRVANMNREQIVDLARGILLSPTATRYQLAPRLWIEEAEIYTRERVMMAIVAPFFDIEKIVVDLDRGVDSPGDVGLAISWLEAYCYEKNFKDESDLKKKLEKIESVVDNLIKFISIDYKDSGYSEYYVEQMPSDSKLQNIENQTFSYIKIMVNSLLSSKHDSLIYLAIKIIKSNKQIDSKDMKEGIFSGCEQFPRIKCLKEAFEQEKVFEQASLETATLARILSCLYPDQKTSSGLGGDLKMESSRYEGSPNSLRDNAQEEKNKMCEVIKRIVKFYKEIEAKLLDETGREIRNRYI